MTTIRTQTGKSKDVFIKIFDESVAGALNALGFTYITENLNGKTVFVFENTPAIRTVLESDKQFYGDAEQMFGDSLCF